MAKSASTKKSVKKAPAKKTTARKASTGSATKKAASKKATAGKASAGSQTATKKKASKKTTAKKAPAGSALKKKTAKKAAAGKTPEKTSSKSASKKVAKKATKKTSTKSLADIANKLRAAKSASKPAPKKATRKTANKTSTTGIKTLSTTKKSTSKATTKKGSKALPQVSASSFKRPRAERGPGQAGATSSQIAKDLGLEFIGRFPMRKSGADKKIDIKKATTGPVFETASYKVVTYGTPLCEAYIEEFKANFSIKHSSDGLEYFYEPFPTGEGSNPAAATRTLLERVASTEFDMLVLNMKDFPLDLPKGLTIATSFKREDARDVLISRSTYGAIQELPRNASIAANSQRRIMQIRALRPDLKVVPCVGDIHRRMKMIDNREADALVVSWSSLRRLNISPRYYVSLQADLMVPAPCQGTVGVVCREEDANLLSKLRYIEDSEASWSSRCERAFLQKMGGKPSAPIGALANRKGTQDPWILDIAVGDPKSGDILKHREIGTSRCKPESLADKAFAGVLGKGARRFMLL